ncbi:MAG: RluA family pseudouridine synthase [Pseudomonadota bacterium]|nr:RluA family pseudouridine synthase [Pseudomonadota bacterium]
MRCLYEDDLLWVLDKPAGLLVTAKDGQQSLEELLTEASGETAHLVHRLDKDTSGVILVAKNQPTREYLQKQFKQRTVHKTYLALLDGDLSTDYVLQETYLARDKHRRTQMRSYPKHDTQHQQLRFARSEFFVLQRFQQRLTYVKITISTGRTHQIRVHAKEMSAPVLGDQVYHHPTTLPLTFPVAIRDEVYNLSRQMLHSHQLAFQHPDSGRMCLSSPPPDDFSDLLTMLRRSAVE